MDFIEPAKMFKEKGRLCVVLKNDRSYLIYPNGFHNGYVETDLKNIDYNRYMDNTTIDINEEPTFSGTLPIKGLENKWFIGFDSAHWCDTEKTQSLKSVTKRTKRFVRDIIKIEKDWKKQGIL